MSEQPTNHKNPTNAPGEPLAPGAFLMPREPTVADEYTPEQLAEAERQENLALSRAEKADAIDAREARR